MIGGDNGTYSENGVQYTTVTNSIEVFDAKTGSFVTDDLDVPSYPLALMGIGAAFLPTGEVVGVGGFGYESNGAFFYTQNTYLLKDDVNSEGSMTFTSLTLHISSIHLH